MTNRYTNSHATGTGTGASWANAFTTLTLANAGTSAGDTGWISNNHAESAAGAVTLTSPGTASAPCSFFCANDSVATPANADLLTTATVSTTLGNTMNFNGFAYYYGIVFTAGSSTNNAAMNVGSTSGVANGLTFDSCTLKLGSSGTTARLNIGNGTATGQTKVTLKNSNVQVSNASQGIILRGGTLEWIGGVLSGATAATTLFLGSDVLSSLVYIRDVDLSLLGSGKTICGAFTNAQRVIFERCILGSSVTKAATQTNPGTIIDFINCDSGAVNYNNSRHMQAGTLTTETAVVMSGGASAGGIPYSHKIVTTANANVFQPFESFVLAEDYISSIGSPVSQTFELLTDNVTLTDQQAWIDWEYLSSSNFPQGAYPIPAANGVASVQTSFGGFFASGNNLTTSTATWNGTGGFGTPVMQKIVTTFTPNMAGTWRAVLKVAKATTTLYVNPPTRRTA